LPRNKDGSTAEPAPEVQGGTDAGAPSQGAGGAGTGGEAEPAAVLDGPAMEPAADVTLLRERVAALETRERELSDQYVRLLAEFDNYRRRTRQEMDSLRLAAAERLITDVLPVLDSLDHALAAAGEDAASPLGQGVRLIRQQLADVLARHGVDVIDAVGQPFDPNLMEAVAQVEADDGTPPGHVVEELRRGYRLHGKVLRPSLVKVKSAQ